MTNPREASQALTANKTLFPSGIKGIADYAHQKGSFDRCPKVAELHCTTSLVLLTVDA